MTPAHEFHTAADAAVKRVAKALARAERITDLLRDGIERQPGEQALREALTEAGEFIANMTPIDVDPSGILERIDRALALSAT